MTPSGARLPLASRLHQLFRALSPLSAFWAFITILFGADVTFTGSAAACPEWPFCSSSAPITFTGHAGIEFIHRISALILSLLILALLIVALWAERRRPVLLRLSILSFVLVVIQALVGGAIIFSAESSAVVVLHLGLATLLFGVLIVIAVLANLPYLPKSWWIRFTETEEPQSSAPPVRSPVTSAARSEEDGEPTSFPHSASTAPSTSS